MNHSVWSYRNENCNIIVWKGGFFKTKLFFHCWCWELDAGNSTLDTHKENSDGGNGDEGEDALRMGVKTEVLCYTAGSVVTLVIRNVFLHSFLPSSNSYELSHWCQVLLWRAKGKGKTCSYGAENQLDETELDMLTNREKEMGRLCTGRLRREGLRRLKRFRHSHSPVLQGSSSDFRVSEPTLCMSSAKRKELVECHQCSPRPRQWST